MKTLHRKTDCRLTRLLLPVWFIISGPVACAQDATPEPPGEFAVTIDHAPIERKDSPRVSSYSDVLKRATPAVISVHTARVVRIVRGGSNLSPQEQLLRRFFGLPVPQNEAPTVEERLVPQGIGSGVVVTADGYIVTNNHVVNDERGNPADEILVQLTDGRELPARVVGRDARTDIAVLKVEATDLPTVSISDSETIEVGDIVFAIGNPLGVGLTVTQGIVSATRRKIGIYGEEGFESFIQTDASINPGNSGGALIDAEGRLIGVNSVILSRSGGSIGIGFAIPSNLVVTIMTHLVANGEVRRGMLGISFNDLSPDLAEAFGLTSLEGVLIERVEPGSPADKAGLRHGDIVIKAGGRTMPNANEFRLLLGQTLPGTSIEFEILRDGEPVTLSAVVADLESAATLQGGGILLDGVEVAPLTREIRDAYKIPAQLDGIAVTSVSEDSGLGQYLREGMVLIEINDRVVTNLTEAKQALRRGANKLYIYDRGRTGYFAVRIP
ncbi:MAG: Do family serine endopeptidase [Opitutaceae bacterium]